MKDTDKTIRNVWCSSFIALLACFAAGSLSCQGASAPVTPLADATSAIVQAHSPTTWLANATTSQLQPGVSPFAVGDPEAPLIVSATGRDNRVTVVFSAPVRVDDAVMISHYAISNLYGNVAVVGANLDTDGRTVQLVTSAQLPFMTHWLTVNGIADAATGTHVIALDSQVVYTNIAYTSGYLQSDYYLGIPGTNLSALLTNPRYPDAPNRTQYLTNSYWYDSSVGVNYGNRMVGLLRPQTSGSYVLLVYSQGYSQLSLGTNENPASARVIATTTNGYLSESIPLLAGQDYFLEALTKEGTNAGDIAEIGWLPPGGTNYELIPTKYLGNFLALSNVTLTISQQPTDTSLYEGYRATFRVAAISDSKIPSLNYQWQSNGVVIPDATDASYTTPPLTSVDNGTVYRVLVFVPGAAQFSSNAVVTVVRDLDPPTVEQALWFNRSSVQLRFSETLDLESATNLAHYAFTNSVAITRASLDATKTIVTLTTVPLVEGSNYTLVINQVRDLARVPNVIETNTLVTFTATPPEAKDIGSPAPASQTTVLDDGLNVIAGGNDIGGISDQFFFNSQLCAGDFDVCVRVSALAGSDLWAKAGIMARDSLIPGSRFAATLTTPSMNGAFFAYRDLPRTAANSAGNFPVNFPSTWLRLQRVGTNFTGFASYDGAIWTPLGSIGLALSNTVYVGLAVCGHNNSQPATAEFRDWQNVDSRASVGEVDNPHEALGPCSRRTPIVISEIMYKPSPRADRKNLEFIELYNSNPWFHDIGGYQLIGDNLRYTFAKGTTLAGGGFLVVAAAPQDLQSVYGIDAVLGPYSGSLKKSGTLQLLDEQDAVLLTIPYANEYPWPAAAFGTGHSLVLANPTYGEADPRAWDISDTMGGSPGALDSYHPSPLRQVVINELLAYFDNPDLPDFVELYNHGNQTNDLSGCVLTDNPSLAKFVIPPGTLIEPGQFLGFTRLQLGWDISAAKSTLYFIQPDGHRVLDAVTSVAQPSGVSYGRWPDGADTFYPLTAPTPGASNAAIWIGDVVISELMYDPISRNDDDQYIELYNKGNSAISLANWQFTAGISFTFPTSAVLEAHTYLVVARNRTNLLAKYSNLSEAITLGNYSGRLAHSGERVALSMPRTLGNGASVYVVADEVTYGTGGRWGQWASGGGSSLELIDPRSNHRLAANWADSDETHKSSWTTIEITGVLDNGQNYSSSIYAQLGLLDVGECLVDNVEVRSGTNGPNLVRNPDFESALTNWSCQGCMVRSSLEDIGYSSAHSLRVRCSSRFWTGVNFCQAALSPNSLASGQTATLRLKARWLQGWPEIAMRLSGNWLEATGALPVPNNLGTPGAPNSRRVSNAGPAIYEVTHTPALPASQQPVVITARLQDPDGIKKFELNYRSDYATGYQTAPMHDDGLDGDAIANDGVFSATLRGQSSGILAFCLTATDNRGATNRFPALVNDNAPVRECAVAFGDPQPSGSFGVYHLWVTYANVNRWNSLPNLSNEMIDGTFVQGRRVIYNMQARFTGSPYHQQFYNPTYSVCHYKWVFPEDDKFLGATSFNKIHAPGNGPGDDSTLQCEQTANTFLRALGVPWLNRRYVALYINGNRPMTLMEDAQTPDNDFINQFFPDDPDGFLYKMQPWFEFSPVTSGYYANFNNVSWCNLVNYTTTGGAKKLARYRYNFEVRRTPDSANNFTNVFALVDAASYPGAASYVPLMQSLADMENWMRVFAANHAAGNWDAFGSQNSQNVYGYRGLHGTKYSLLMFDFNISVGNSGSWGPGENLFTVNGQDPNTGAIYNNPVFRRMYLRALQELVNGPLDIAQSGPLLDAKYNAFVANGLHVTSPDETKTWLDNARVSIAAQIAPQTRVSFSVGRPSAIDNMMYVSGSAPVSISTILLNGVEWPLTWYSITNWRVMVPLQSGTNQFTVTGVDRFGQPVAGCLSNIGMVYDGTVLSPAGQVVINEIMYQPTRPGAQYVELANISSNLAFDLSGWQLPELSYTFPAGSLIRANRTLVLAANRSAFASAYGNGIVVSDTFNGVLSTNGQTLTLVRPGSADAENLVVAQVRYESAAPWPAGANGLGSSLELIDPSRDNWRVANWAGNFPPLSRSPGSLISVPGSLPAFPSLYLNEVLPDNQTGLTNLAGDPAPWLELYNPSAQAINLSGLYLANNFSNLTQWAFPEGTSINPGEFKVIFADNRPELTTPQALHAALVLSTGSGSLALSQLDSNGLPEVLDYLNYTNLAPDHAFGSVPDGQSFVRMELAKPTPGLSNAATNSTNTAPTITALGDQFVYLGHTLRLLVAAHDPDSPPQILTFALDPLSPTNAAIDPTNGLLTWTPLSLQASQTNPFTVLVTDNGLPPLTGSASFSVVVAVAPKLAVAQNQENQITFAWPTLPKRRYQVEYRDTLEPGEWTPLGSPFVGNGQSLSVTNNLAIPAQRFFRLRILD